MRRSIARKECYCTNEIFMWPSIVYQPAQLLRRRWSVRACGERVTPLAPDERADYTASAAPLTRVVP